MYYISEGYTNYTYMTQQSLNICNNNVTFIIKLVTNKLLLFAYSNV